MDHDPDGLSGDNMRAGELFDKAPVPTLLLSRDVPDRGCITYANDAACAMFATGDAAHCGAPINRDAFAGLAFR